MSENRSQLFDTSFEWSLTKHRLSRPYMQEVARFQAAESLKAETRPWTRDQPWFHNHCSSRPSHGRASQSRGQHG